MADHVKKLDSAWATLKNRVNRDIPSRRNQIKSVTSRLNKYKPPTGGGR